MSAPPWAAPAGRRSLLAFVEDPGAANAVLGLSQRVARRGVDMHLVVTGAASAFLAARNEPFEELGAGESAASLLARIRPDAVFVGTAESPDTLALPLVSEARRRAVPSAGFVDAVSCADHRWRGRTDDPLAHCPDHVLVCDAETEDAFVALGVSSDRVHRCGHPQFDAVLETAAELAKEPRDQLRSRAFPGLHARGADRRVVVFCGERSTGGFDDPAFDAQFRRSSDYTLHGRGRSQTRTEIVTEEVLDALRELPERPFSALRYHPKNQPSDFGPLNEEFDTVSSGGSALTILAAADLVIGMSSMVLLEATLLGAPTLSVVARPAEHAWLPATARERTPVVATRDALRGFLRDWSTALLTRVEHGVQGGAIERLAELLATLARR